ncbi:MAG: hypothetical protein QGG36_21780 [Pirellulaceae bacterium]|jgi:hypothetical protein|nr:hypothetical protein [Pirellulaceae bacterium]
MPDIRDLDEVCSRCGGWASTCKYNHFHQGDLEIHSWEHKCPDCGNRQTTAFRSDSEDLDTSGRQQRVCPYCGRSAPPP